MAQRSSGYERKARNLYETPPWVANVLNTACDKVLDLCPGRDTFWEPACASGNISKTLGAKYSSDLVTDFGTSGVNFLEQTKMPDGCKGIITNPPFGKDGERFIRHGLKLLEPVEYGFMWMLLPTDFDCAKTRSDIFGSRPGLGMRYHCKIILTERIVWFEPAIAQPSSNHAWYFWSAWPSLPYHPVVKYHYKEKHEQHRSQKHD